MFLIGSSHIGMSEVGMYVLRVVLDLLEVFILVS